MTERRPTCEGREFQAIKKAGTFRTVLILGMTRERQSNDQME